MDLAAIEEHLDLVAPIQKPHWGRALWRDCRDLLLEVKRQDELLRAAGLGAMANGDRCDTCRRIGAEIVATL